ncbi:MAG: alpha/beta hydrolase [Chloroflexota bacterium]
MRMRSPEKRFSGTGLVAKGFANLALVVVVLFTFNAQTSTPQFKDQDGKIIEGSIAEERQLTLGGVEQTVLLRGRDRTAPLLVFVHGGPGATATPFLRTYNADLEDSFVVAYWDQRGTAKSYNQALDPADMTIAQLTADLGELIDQLLVEFEQDQVLLVAHSWGTIIGLEYAASRPETVAGFISVSQTTNQMASDRLGHEWALNEAQLINNQNAVDDLNEIGQPEYTIEEFYTQRRWVNVLGGGLYKPQSDLTLLTTALRTSEFGWTDLRSFFAGTQFSSKALWDEQQAYDARARHSDLDVPVFMMIGRHDKIIAPELGASYFNFLKAPSKELIWFEQSAHAPLFEEPEKFNYEVLRIAIEVGLMR